MAKKKAPGKTSPVGSPAKPGEQVRSAKSAGSSAGYALLWQLLVSMSMHVLQGDTQTQLNNLRDEGNTYFGKKDYAKALESYDKALKLIPSTHQDKPLLHSNKAACHMMAKKYADVAVPQSMPWEH